MSNSTSNDDQVHESQKEDDKADPSGASQMQY